MNKSKCNSDTPCAFKNINSNISDDTCRFEGICDNKIVYISKCTSNNICHYENNNSECTLKKPCQYQNYK